MAEAFRRAPAPDRPGPSNRDAAGSPEGGRGRDLHEQFRHQGRRAEGGGRHRLATGRAQRAAIPAMAVGAAGDRAAALEPAGAELARQAGDRTLPRPGRRRGSPAPWRAARPG
jgi:hypothetical protein